MNKSFNINYILNFLLTIFSSYIALFLSDFFISNLIKNDISPKLNKTTINFVKKLQKNALRKTIELKEEGYLPVVNPNALLKNQKNSKIESWLQFLIVVFLLETLVAA